MRRRAASAARGAAGVMSRQVVELRYIHADDGRPYRHEFRRGVAMQAMRDGSIRLYRPDGKPMWDDFPGGD